MKRLTLLIITCLLSVISVAQTWNVQLEAGKETKAVLEGEKFTDNSYFYAYSEWVINSKDNAVSNWAQIIYERRLGSAPIYAHGEFRTGLTTDFSFGNTYLVGAAYNILSTEKGMINFDALYRYENEQHEWQFSFVSSASFGKLQFSNYIDVWGQDWMMVCSENKLYYPIMKNVKIGANIELGYNYRHIDKWSFYPFGIVKYEF